MKILYVSKPYFADSDFPLIRAYQNKGADVTVLFQMWPLSKHATLFNIDRRINRTCIMPASEYPELKMYEDYIDLSKVYISYRATNTSYSPSYYLEAFNIRQFIKSGNYDVIHFIGIFDVRRLGIYKLCRRIITTVHDPLPHSDEKNIEKINSIRRKVLSYYNGIVLLNSKQKDEFCELYNINPDKLLINRLGVYECLTLFANNIVTNANNILFFGNIRPYKGLEYLCKAMEIVHKKQPQAVLTIAGGGSLYFSMEPFVNAGYVRLINRYISTQELAEYLSNSAFCVCPYTDATQSGVIMTAYSLLKPVVATSVGGLSEMIEDGKNGILVRPRDVESLANAIIELLEHPQELLSYSERIKEEYYKGKKSWEDISNKYIAYYQKIIDLA